MNRKRNVRLSVTRGMSGWFVVMLGDFEEMGWETDTIQTGIGRYKEKEDAINELKEWSRSELIPIEKGLLA